MKHIFSGDNLLKARITAKMSRREVGEKVGVSQNTIKEYEMNRTQPKLGRIKEIAQAVGLTVEDLIPSSQHNTINGNNNAPIKDNNHNVLGDNNHVIHNNYNCNEKLEQIEKAILEMENIDPKTAMQILKIIKTYKD